MVALVAIIAAILTAYASAETAKRNALDWYIATAFPDYELTAQSGSHPDNNVSARTAELISNSSNISRKIAIVPGVSSAQSYVPLMLSTLQGTNATNATVDSAAMFQGHEQSFVQKLYEGSDLIGPRQILIPSSVASYLGLRAGMPAKLFTDFAFTAGPCMNVTCPAQPAEVNVSVAGIYEPAPGALAGFQGIFPWASSNLNAPLILNFSTLLSVLTNLTSLNVSAAQDSLLSNAYTRYDVLVDRGSILDPTDAVGSTLRLARLKAQLSALAIEFSLQLSSPLEIAYREFLNDQRYLDLTVLVFSTPVAIIGVYGGILLGRTEALTRYRDFYIASARGASRRLLFASLGVEALFETSIAFFAGGTAFWVATQFAELGLPVTHSSFRAEVLLVALSLSVFVSLMSKVGTLLRVFRAGRRSRLLEPRLTELPAGPSKKIALGLFSAGLAFLAVTPFATAPLIETTVTQSILFGLQKDWFLGFAVFAFVYGGVLVLLIPRRKGLVQRDLDSNDDPPTVYRKAATRSGKWPEPALLVVASLALSLAILVPGLVQLDGRSLSSAIYGETGGDVLLLYPGSFPNQRPGSNNPPIAALRNVSGVESLTFSSLLRSKAGLSLVLLDTKTYLPSIRLEMIEYGEEVQNAFSGSTQPGTAVANVAAAETYGLTVGMTFGNLTIVGVLSRVPGVEDSSSVSTPTLFTDYLNVGTSPNSTDITHVVVRLASLDRARMVQANLLALDPRAAVENAPGELEVLSHSPVFSSLSTTASITVGASTMVLATTVVGSLLASAAELGGDLTRMRARGLTRRQASRIAGGLILKGVVASVVAGGVIGFVGFFGFAWASGHSNGFAVSLSRIAINPVAIVAAFYFSFTAIGSWIVSRRVTGHQFGALLRERIS